MSDMILRRMPKLPLGGEDAIRAFPVLAELKKSHDKIKADPSQLENNGKNDPFVEADNLAKDYGLNECAN